MRIIECRIRKGTHIKTDDTVQISEGLDDDLPHIEVGALEELLYRNLFVILCPDLELWGKCIASPETGPVYSTERLDTDKIEGSLR